MPKENDALNGRRRLGSGSVRRIQDEDAPATGPGSANRDGLVTLLNVASIPVVGAVAISDDENDCSKNSDDCCDSSGACCGVSPGCNCPTVSQTYCTATSCDLPGCCGPYSLEMVNRNAPKFVGCFWTLDVCLCGTSDCYPDGACGKFAVCGNSADQCSDYQERM